MYEFIVFPHAFLRGPAVSRGPANGIGFDTLAVETIVSELPDVLGAIGPCKSALTVETTVPELPDVLIAIGEDSGTLAVEFTVPELPDVVATIEGESS